MKSLPLQFFLGGSDLEMLEISKLARSAGQVVHDKGLAWDAALSAYAHEIALCHAAGQQAVVVELENDLPPHWPARECLVEIDHHNARAGQPSALQQVFTLLKLPPERWTRHLQLVAINDVAHIDGLRQAGASESEILALRQADRVAQGITPRQEVAGFDALAAATVLEQRLTVVQLPHGRMAPVTDALALEKRFGAFPKDCLVIAPGEAAFFGAGPVVKALSDAFPQGWWGGNLPLKGFWGLKTAQPDQILLADICLQTLKSFANFSKDR